MKMAIVRVFLIVVIAFCSCHAIEAAEADKEAAHDIKKRDNDIIVNFHNLPNNRDGCEGKVGPKGEQGVQGEQGPPGPSGGGAVYTIWGRRECPQVNGTEEIHKGYTVGGNHYLQGGGANYICITKTPEYFAAAAPVTSEITYLYTAEYQVPETNLDHGGVPCAVCNTPQRSSKMMLPGQISCPPTWTEEYDGYLIAERTHENHKRNAVYECLDDDTEITEGRAKGNYGNAPLVDYVVAKCGNVNSFLPCPPFVDNKRITCVVCTK